jgi:hypothetical protein
MEFCETDGPWQQLPKWINFLINFGLVAGEVEPDTRRISVVSLPWDSAGAGLIALGAMRYRLSLNDADDCSSHFRHLQLLPTQEPPIYLRHEKYRGRFVVARRDEQDRLWVKRVVSATKQDGPPETVIFPWNSFAWKIEGEAPVQVLSGAKLPYASFYEAISASAILPCNLTRSDSGLCLAGRVTGEAAFHQMLASIRFRMGEQFVDLSRLLTLCYESDQTVSRLAFFNTRTGHLSRRIGSPRLVIADGDVAFLRVIESDQFRNSDVVGVIHRTLERDRLELLGYKLADLVQWYAPDTGRYYKLRGAQAGITIASLKQRQP